MKFTPRQSVRNRPSKAFDYWLTILVWHHVGVYYTDSPLLVRLAGIEPTTLGFGGQYSIH